MIAKFMHLLSIRIDVTDLGTELEAISTENNLRSRFNPEPPPGFIRRSDPNFFFLSRKY